MKLYQKNQELELTITSLTVDGNGVGKTDEGFAIFVPRTAIGDRVRVLLLKVEKRFAFAKVVEILTPSKDRIEDTECPVYQQCGGCSFRHISYPSELAAKAQMVTDAMTRVGGITAPVAPIVPSPQTAHYRNKAQFPIQSLPDGKVAIGFFAKNSHRVVEVDSCPLQPEIFAPITRMVKAFLETNKIPIYDETTRQGLVRHLYLRQGQRSGEIMVCLVVNGGGLQGSEKLVADLTAAFPQISTICLNHNRKNGNIILGKEVTLLFGKPMITEVLCDLTFAVSPLSFFQVNTLGAEQLYQKAARLAQLKKDDILLDLYCGTGSIGLSMASQVDKVIGVEIEEQAVEDARRNAWENKIQNARFILGDAAKAAQTLRDKGLAPSIVVIDPPRKGCEEPLINTIAELSPSRVLMISCNPATAARDAARLIAHGYEVTDITPLDLFPRTSHVESIWLLQKKA